MKNIAMTIAAIALASASFTTFAATEVQSAPAGQQSIGVVSATAGNDLGSLEHKLAAKAEKQGASSYRIISAGGDNYLYGTAEIYK
ncbi:multiple stress resistance protein BhsA [Rouxiella sp. Mn2063]|uniref:multiple stress resistance protein BhsA n=1 Tax=Rouxiella sp. Mn2063 TaxID=3395262 RepID=UPI003BC8B56B